MSTIKERMQPPVEYSPLKTVPNPNNPILVSGDEINRQLIRLAEHLAPRIQSLRNPILMSIANGGLIFGQDLAIELNRFDPELPFETKTIQYLSRRGVSEKGDQRPMLDERMHPFPDVEGRTVILIDDVADTCATIVEAELEVRKRGGTVSDVIVAVEKLSPDEFKGDFREYHLPTDVRLTSLATSPAIWLYGYGMDNGNDATEVEDRSGRAVKVNWDYERRDFPRMVEYYLEKYGQNLI